MLLQSIVGEMTLHLAPTLALTLALTLTPTLTPILTLTPTLTRARGGAREAGAHYPGGCHLATLLLRAPPPSNAANPY